MSCSCRKTPITGRSMAPSEKDDKHRYNCMLLRLNRERLVAFGEDMKISAFWIGSRSFWNRCKSIFRNNLALSLVGKCQVE